LLIISECGTLLCSIKTYFMLNLFIFQFLNHNFTNKAKFSYATVALKQRHVNLLHLFTLRIERRFSKFLINFMTKQQSCWKVIKKVLFLTVLFVLSLSKSCVPFQSPYCGISPTKLVVNWCFDDTNCLQLVYKSNIKFVSNVLLAKADIIFVVIVM
jgi:hypothetical protein